MVETVNRNHAVATATATAADTPPTIDPFSLTIPANKKSPRFGGRKGGSLIQRLAVVADSIQEQCKLDSWDDIEDAYPCTALQEGFMALSQKNPGSYTDKNVLKLGRGVDIGRFKAAWEATLQNCPHMRTRFVLLDGRNTQAIIRTKVNWETTDGLSLQAFMHRYSDVLMGYGVPLLRYGIIREGDDHYFIYLMHHATFDGWSNALMFRTLYSAYEGTPTPEMAPFSRFIKYLIEMDQDAAQRHWSHELQNAITASFPEPTAGQHRPLTNSSRVYIETIPIAHDMDTSLTMATFIRGAWALLLADYCDNDDVCFGTIVSGRNAPVANLDSMPGPTIATVPVRIRVDRNQLIPDFLRDIQAQAHRSTPFEQYGIQNISKLSPEAREACNFTSLLAIQPVQSMFSSIWSESILETPESTIYDAKSNVDGYFNYPLVLQVHTADDSIKLVSTYQQDHISEARIQAMSKHLGHIINQLLTLAKRPLSQIQTAGQWDIDMSRSYNPEAPEIFETTFHAMFEKQVSLSPDAVAIQAHDGSLTYAELDAAANRFAQVLVKSYGVSVGDLIHVCFEKSLWHIVAILAINKAGGAWVPLDPSHPPERLQQITSSTKAALALASTTNVELMAPLIEHVLEISAPAYSRLTNDDEDLGDCAPFVEMSARDPAYVLFTSGSTGTPKGLVIEHQSLCTSQMAISKRIGLDSSVRILQFSAFVFDLSVGEIIGPLIMGSTICIPAEKDRTGDLTSFMNSTSVSWAYLTPSFARTLDIKKLPTLELLVVCGEAPNRDVLDQFYGQVRLLNAWGPAETCCMSGVHEYTSIDDSPLCVGLPVGGHGWIVDPNDHDRLAPIGKTGEIVIQGPTVLREYLANPIKTQESTISAPTWAIDRSAPWDRAFKTGDLGRYDSNGRIEYVDRKDTQVKIRGLRIELGDIEHHAATKFTEAKQISVDVSGRSSGSDLACFFSFSSERRVVHALQENPVLEMRNTVRTRLVDLKEELEAILPPYMVPAVWVPLAWMPTLTSGKVNRKVLQELAGSISPEKIASYSLGSDEKRQPRTDLERKVRDAYARVLNIPSQSIGIDDDFYHLGGNSISIINLGRVIEQEFHAEVRLSLLNGQRKTVLRTAKYIETALNGNEEPEISKMSLMTAVAQSASCLTGEPLSRLMENPQVALPRDATAFLTGATGYLGSEILRQLLIDDSFKKVIVLVRASSVLEGMERIKKSAEDYGWWLDSLAANIEVWVGDLQEPRLGLDDGQWRCLSGSSTCGVDAIVHNGAVVNWNASYDALEAANVQSVVDLLLCSMVSPRNTKFIFISGGTMNDTSKDRASIAEGLSDLTGYIQTKFVAETVVEEVAQCLPPHQNRVSTIKPGRIIGTPEKGVANLDDYVWRVVGTAIAMGAHPTDPSDSWMPIQSVDTVAFFVKRNLVTTESIKSFQNLDMGTTVEEFWLLVNSQLDKPLRATSWDEWADDALKLSEAVGGEKHPIYSIQNFLSRLGFGEGPTSMHANDEFGESLRDAVRACTRHIIQAGFVDLCKGDATQCDNFIQRSSGVRYTGRA